MRLSKILKLSLNMLLHSKLRSWLTIIGIFIGVAAVVSIISIGEGLQSNVQSTLGGLGQDIVTITAGSSRASEGFRHQSQSSVTNVKPLSKKDVQTLKLVSGVKYINSIISGRTDVYSAAETASISIRGMDKSVFKEFMTADIDSGRYLTQGDSKAVVVGDDVANDMFKKPLSVGHSLSINDRPFRIVGILQTSSGFGSSDNIIYMSTEDAREVLGDLLDLEKDEFSSIDVKVDDENFILDTADRIEKALMNSRHVREDTKDFSVSTPLALQERFSEVTQSITIFLGAIALVSLIVGAVGVANTMFTSVLEKTKEIGIMKAIGSKNRDILLIFLFNSGMLGLVGGIIGVGFGSLVSYILPNLGFGVGGGPFRGGLQTVLNPNLLIFSLAFSIIIGMISGALPAYRASKLKPVEALRYE